MKMTYDEAVKKYFAADNGDGVTLQPGKLEREMDATGRWILRNTNGFLAYVTSTGKVLDQHFQTIGE